MREPKSVQCSRLDSPVTAWLTHGNARLRCVHLRDGKTTRYIGNNWLLLCLPGWRNTRRWETHSLYQTSCPAPGSMARWKLSQPRGQGSVTRRCLSSWRACKAASWSKSWRRRTCSSRLETSASSCQRGLLPHPLPSARPGAMAMKRPLNQLQINKNFALGSSLLSLNKKLVFGLNPLSALRGWGHPSPPGQRGLRGAPPVGPVWALPCPEGSELKPWRGGTRLRVHGPARSRSPRTAQELVDTPRYHERDPPPATPRAAASRPLGGGLPPRRAAHAPPPPQPRPPPGPALGRRGAGGGGGKAEGGRSRAAAGAWRGGL